MQIFHWDGLSLWEKHGCTIMIQRPERMPRSQGRSDSIAYQISADVAATVGFFAVKEIQGENLNRKGPHTGLRDKDDISLTDNLQNDQTFDVEHLPDSLYRLKSPLKERKCRR